LSWDSIGFEWPVDKPIVSDRDGQHLALSQFNSPFSMAAQ